MADGYNLGQMGTMSPELYEQQQQLNRQQKMAQLLMQNTKQPQGQMIGNRFVAPSFLQNLVPLANMYVSSSLAKEGDEKALELSKALKAQHTDELNQFNQLLNKSPMEAYSFAAQAYNPSLQKIGMEKMIPKEFELPEGTKRFITMPDGTVKEVASGGEKLHTVKGNLVTSSGKVIYSAPLTGEDEGFGGQGRFNKKGDYIAPGGVFIGKAEVAKDREIARSANELRQGLQEISPKDIKATASIFGDVNQGGPISYLAKQFENPAVAAQAKVNASSVMQTLQNLPPGPASDKDIAQARSSFPGYGNAKDLQDWVNNTNNMLERKINNVNQKYGSEDWYGAQGINTKKPNSSAVANPQDQAALAWANANPNDPRSAQIKQRLSGK